MAKYKHSTFVSPRGTFRFAWLDKPDDKFATDDKPGHYKATLLLEDTDENRAWCEKVYKAGITEAKEAGTKLKKKAKSPFIMPEDVDEEDFEEDEDGNSPKYSEECREKIMFETKSGYKPGLIDAKKKTLKDGVKIMGGDEGKVKVQVNPYEGFGSGVSLRLRTGQLLEKNTTFSGGADTEGFDEEEGYSGDPEDGDEEEEQEDF